MKLSRPSAASPTDILRYHGGPPMMDEPARMAAFPPTIANTAPVACTQAVPSACAAGPLWKIAIRILPTAFAAASVRNSPGLACVDRSNGEDGADEKERSLHDRTRCSSARPVWRRERCSEITDEVVDVAVMRPKRLGRDSFEDQIRQSAGHPRNGRADGVCRGRARGLVIDSLVASIVREREVASIIRESGRQQ